MFTGNPARHYFLPTLPPLALLAAIGLIRGGQWQGRVGRLLRGIWKVPIFLAVPVLGAGVVAYANPRERGTAAEVYAVGAFMTAHATPRCAFVFNSFPILYYLSGTCLPSKFAFPNHLSEASEVQTGEGSRYQELARVLGSRPGMIFVRRPYSSDLDAKAIDMLESTLRDDYALGFQRNGVRHSDEVYLLRGDTAMP
jgi:hypothetical protein